MIHTINSSLKLNYDLLSLFTNKKLTAKFDVRILGHSKDHSILEIFPLAS